MQKKRFRRVPTSTREVSAGELIENKASLIPGHTFALSECARAFVRRTSGVCPVFCARQRVNGRLRRDEERGGLR